MEVWPEVITPSTGMLSPGSTRSRSPTRTCPAGTMFSPSGSSRRAVCGVRCTSFSMPARARATVTSSSSAPSCMMKATSPAAKSSPISTEAISARDTSTSALMSKAVIRPMSASSTMGTPQSTMATHAASNGRGRRSKMLTTSAAPEIASSAISFWMPPHSRKASVFCTSVFISASRIILIGVYPYYSIGGRACQAEGAAVPPIKKRSVRSRPLL